MLIPQVVGFKLTGRLPEGATATDLVLTVTQMLRKHGVVGKFVEFFGDGLQHLPLADRATIANMAPEYGATCGIFPIDAGIADLSAPVRPRRRTDQPGRKPTRRHRACGTTQTHRTRNFSSTLELNLADVKPSLAGPKRPQDRVLLGDVGKSYRDSLGSLTANRKPKAVSFRTLRGRRRRNRCRSR